MLEGTGDGGGDRDANVSLRGMVSYIQVSGSVSDSGSISGSGSGSFFGSYENASTPTTITRAPIILDTATHCTFFSANGALAHVPFPERYEYTVGSPWAPSATSTG